MTFTPTNQCPALPDHMNPKTTPKPLRDVTDAEIDDWLQLMLASGPNVGPAPAYQHGRRVAVQMFLSRR